MFRMLAVFADFECSMIRERVTAGLSRAKADGIQLGQLEDTNVEGGGDRRGSCQRDRDPNCSRVPGGHGPVGDWRRHVHTVLRRMALAISRNGRGEKNRRVW
jgi:hypothetical protein